MVGVGLGETVGDGVGDGVGEGVGLLLGRTLCVLVGLGVGDGVGDLVGLGVGFGVQVCRAVAEIEAPLAFQTVALRESTPTTELVKVTVAVPAAPVVPVRGKVVLLGPLFLSNWTQIPGIGLVASSVTRAVKVAFVPTCDEAGPEKVMPTGKVRGLFGQVPGESACAGPATIDRVAAKSPVSTSRGKSRRCVT